MMMPAGFKITVRSSPHLDALWLQVKKQKLVSGINAFRRSPNILMVETTIKFDHSDHPSDVHRVPQY